MTLLEYLERHWLAEELFMEGEFTEITRHIYILLRRAILEQANELTITPTNFLWSKNGKLIGKRLLPKLEGDKNAYKSALEKILERDKVVKQHMHRTDDSFMKTTFSIDNKI